MFKATLRQRTTTSKKMELRSLAVVETNQCFLIKAQKPCQFFPIWTILLHEDIEEE